MSLSMLPFRSRHTPAGARGARAPPGAEAGAGPGTPSRGCWGCTRPAPLPTPRVRSGRARGAGHSPSVPALPSGTLPKATAGPSRKIVSSPPDTMLPLFSVCRSRVSCLFSTVADRTWRKRPPVTTGIPAPVDVAPLSQLPRQPPGLLQASPVPKGQCARSLRATCPSEHHQCWPHTYTHLPALPEDPWPVPPPAPEEDPSSPALGIPSPLYWGCSCPRALAVTLRPPSLTDPGAGAVGQIPAGKPKDLAPLR